MRRTQYTQKKESEVYTILSQIAFFAGVGATAARDAPAAGIYVLIYEKNKLFFGSVDRLQHSPVGITFASAVTAGLISTFLTNPFDMVKTRIQIKTQRYPNIVAATRLILKVGYYCS